MSAGTLLEFVPRRRRAGLGAWPLRTALEAFGYALFGLFIFFTCFTFLRPSPYDFTAIPAMALWLCLGVALHRGAIVFVALILLYNLGLLIALVPYIDEPDPTAWTFQSFYLMLTGIFFVMFFSEETERRVELGLKAFLASCLFAAVAGLISYVSEGGLFYTMDGRAAGVFEDPNVLGSFLVMGILYLLRGLLAGDGRHPVLALLTLPVLVLAVFVSFSRGSWGALILGTLIMTGLTYRSSVARIRRRIMLIGCAVLVLATVGLGSLLTIGNVAQTFSDRATLTKDYDEGETGRFGNQRRSIPLLAESPNGFGPLRFRLRFELDPHNSYIGGFANGGWLGGFAFIGLVVTTVFVGFRLCLADSPFRRQAQIVMPALLMFFLQAFQIDIDHWRHVYILLGLIWGLECGRLKWLAGRRRTPQPAPGGLRAAPAS